MAAPINTLLSPNQQKFVSAFAQSSGYDPAVVGAWVRNEEPLLNQNTDPAGHGRYNFLNIGITDSQPYGANAGLWKDPTKAGQLSGQWALGGYKVPGYGGAASSLVKALKAAQGKTPAEQIRAIQTSGWASGGEKALPGLYQKFSGMTIPSTPAGTQQLNLALGNAPKGSVSPSNATVASPQGNTFLDFLTAKMASRKSGSTAPSMTSFLNQSPLPNTGNGGNLLGYIQRAEQSSIPGVQNPTQPGGATPITVTAGKGTKATPTVAAAIDLAKEYLGTDYVFGGASPKTGFDCSGIVQYAYGKQGIQLPRTTYEQIKVGTTVPQNALQPGDVMFFGTQSNPHHEALYLGNGQMLEAPHTGAQVRIVKADRSDFVTAKRMT